MYIKCHYCGEVCETEFEPEIGQHVRCPFCGEKFSYSGDGENEQHEMKDSLCEEKLLECACPHCGTVYEITNDEVGNYVKCKNCNEAFTIKVLGGKNPTDESSAQHSKESKNHSDICNSQTKKVPRVRLPQKKRCGNDPTSKGTVRYSINSIVLALLTICKIVMILYVTIISAVVESGIRRRAQSVDLDSFSDQRALEGAVFLDELKLSDAERSERINKRYREARANIAKKAREAQEEGKRLKDLTETIQVLVRFQKPIELLWLVSFLIFVIKLVKRRDYGGGGVCE